MGHVQHTSFLTFFIAAAQTWTATADGSSAWPGVDCGACSGTVLIHNSPCVELSGDGEGKRGPRVKFVEGETIIEVV